MVGADLRPGQAPESRGHLDVHFRYRVGAEELDLREEAVSSWQYSWLGLSTFAATAQLSVSSAPCSSPLQEDPLSEPGVEGHVRTIPRVDLVAVVARRAKRLLTCPTLSGLKLYSPRSCNRRRRAGGHPLARRY